MRRQEVNARAIYKGKGTKVLAHSLLHPIFLTNNHECQTNTI